MLITQQFLRFSKSLILIIFCIANIHTTAQKSIISEADLKFENEAFFTAIDLYKKGEVRIKDVKEKARINYRIAECYKMAVEPEQAQTYYDRAIMLRYQNDDPSIYLSLADVLKEQGDYDLAVENINKYLELIPEQKLNVLLHYLEKYSGNKSIVFCRTKSGVQKLYKQLSANKFKSGAIH